MRLSIARGFLFMSLVAAGALVLGPATARAESRPVSECGQELSDPGDYHLTQDIGPCTGHGVVITGSDVRLTLAGHTVSGLSNPASCDPQIGIDVRNPATGVRISGGTVTGFADGVSLTGGSRVTALRVTDNCGFGIMVVGTGSQVDTSRVSGSVDGILLCGTEDAVVTSNEVFGNSRYGVLISCADAGDDHNHVVRNILRDNGPATGDGGGVGVFGGNEHEIAGNAISGNFLGITLLTSAQTVIDDNTVNGNQTNGIVLTAGAQGTAVHDNTAYGNGLVDLQDDNVCGSNVWTANLFLTGAGCI
jgi:parallel beta-helix repeat protein